MIAGRRLRTWAARLAVAALAVAAGEAAARVALGGRELDPRVFAPSDRSPGYALAAGARSAARMFGRDITMTIGADGRRVTPGAGAQGVEVHVIGDSMVFGWGLDDEEAPPARLQARLGPGFHVVNHGLPGAGPYQYARALREIPAGAWVVVVHTESNDVTDAYRDEVTAGARCGHLSLSPDGLRLAPCVALDSSLVQLAWRAESRVVRWRRATPLQFDDEGRVAARVLGARIDDLDAAAREGRGDRLLFAVVPWDASLVAARVTPYYPPPRAMTRAYAFADDAGTRARFERTDGADALFLPGDDHLSSAGADLLAEGLARALEARGLRAEARR